MRPNFKKVVYRGVPYSTEKPILRYRSIVDAIYRGIKHKTEIEHMPIVKVIK